MKLSDRIRNAVRSWLAVRETDTTLTLNAYSASSERRDRFAWERGEVLRQSVEAWRVNPLARRIVGLTTQYVVGSGITVSCRHKATHDFLQNFWRHHLNRMDVRAAEWCDELTRTGNLFILITTDPGGMSYVRAVPADQIERIESAANDVEQELAFYPKPTVEDPQPRPWPAYDSGGDPLHPCMLHYAINRPVGGQWGESDLAPLLRWLARYANWLEDRARLNRFRNAFLYVVTGRFANETERIARQQVLNANPPGPGSILVCNEGETWAVINPQLESQEAGEDGLALKKMIASGAGVPLHFLAEPESATRTTAEAAGGPTYRHFEQRQRFYLWLIQDILRIVLERRSKVTGPRGPRTVNPAAEIEVSGADISARDNVSLAMAATQIVNALATLRDRQLIDDAEFLRLVYRFAMESANTADLLERGRKAGPPVTAEKTSPTTWALHPEKPDTVDPETGEEKPAADR